MDIIGLRNRINPSSVGISLVNIETVFTSCGDIASTMKAKKYFEEIKIGRFANTTFIPINRKKIDINEKRKGK